MTVYQRGNLQRGFGTFPLQGDALTAALSAAIATGYRAIDTAQMYQNEPETGACIANSNVARSEFCITSKVAPAKFTEADFLPSVEQSLQDLQIDKLDVLLLHWPPADGDIKPSLKLLQRAANEGLTTHIGVSNYTCAMMRDAQRTVDQPLVTNQVEFHPLLNQQKLLDTAAETGIPLAAYCSVARGEVFKYPLFAQIGSDIGKSAAQVVQRWILQKGVTLNTMSTKPENISANYHIDDFALTSTHMAAIDELTHTNYRIVDKNKVPWAPQWD